MSGAAQRRGAWAEALARRHLEANGLRFVCANYRSRYGELDLVMRDSETTVFVEVRLRSRHDFGSGADSIIARKRRRLIACARDYLLRRAGGTEPPCRFDVVSLSGGNEPRIEWIRDAFGA